VECLAGLLRHSRTVIRGQRARERGYVAAPVESAERRRVSAKREDDDDDDGGGNEDEGEWDSLATESGVLESYHRRYAAVFCSFLTRG